MSARGDEARRIAGIARDLGVIDEARDYERMAAEADAEDNQVTYRVEQTFERGEDGLYEYAPGIRVAEPILRQIMSDAAQQIRDRFLEQIVYTAPKGTAIGAPGWTELGYLSEDGLTFRDTRPIPDSTDLYWGRRPHRDYGLPDLDLKATLTTRARKAGKAASTRALKDILARNPAAAAEHRSKP